MFPSIQSDTFKLPKHILNYNIEGLELSVVAYMKELN